MSRNLIVTSLVVLVVVLFFSHPHQFVSSTDNSTIYETHSVPVSPEYIQAIDAAVYSMTIDKSFQSAFSSLMIFSVPQCTSLVSFPTKNPFIGRKALVMCIEQGAVDTGVCDVITTNVQFTEERRKLIHFQCAWGSTSKGFLRTELDPQLTLTSFTSLNQSGVSVSAYKGTTYETDVLTLSQAHYIPLNNSDEQYDLIERRKIHAAVDNSVTLLTWLDENRKSCANCSVYFIGQPYPFATFTTNLISNASAVMKNSIPFLSLIVGFMLIFTNNYYN